MRLYNDADLQAIREIVGGGPCALKEVVRRARAEHYRFLTSRIVEMICRDGHFRLDGLAVSMVPEEARP